MKYLAILALVAVTACGCTQVGADEVGVQHTFGKIEQQLPPNSGFMVIAPWSDVSHYPIRMMEMSEQANVPTSQGLIVKVDATLQFHMDPEHAVDIWSTLGHDLETATNVFVRPNMRNVMRDIIAKYPAEALYSAQREQIATDMENHMTAKLKPRGFIVDDILIRDLVLPQRLTGSIEQKLQAEQEALRMEFILQREEQEADRKRIEASGIADANRIIASGLTDSYLTWYFTNTLGELAKGDNASTVFIPFDQALIPQIGVR